MVKNKKFLVEAPIYMFKKKHSCAYCSSLLTTRKVTRVINSSSPEADGFDFSMGDAYFVGDVEFSWYVFYCTNCKEEVSIKEQKAYEDLLKGRDVSKRRVINRIINTIVFLIIAALYIYIRRPR